MKKISFIIKEDAKNLLEATKQIGLSRNMFNRYAYLGRILVNEKENRRNDRIYKNDRITFLVEDENIKYQKKQIFTRPLTGQFVQSPGVGYCDRH